MQQQVASGARLRARQLGLPLEGTPGPHNAITDVPGVEVGYETVVHLAQTPGERQICSGVTAVLPRGRQPLPLPVWAGQFDFNGNGEMTGCHWIDDAGYFIGPICLTNTHAVGAAHQAAVRFMIETYADHFSRLHAWAMPVVAETYDGLVNDICGQHVTERHALAALHAACSGPIAEGNVGGGAGMATYEFKGGTGTSSRRFEIVGHPYTLGVLVQSNFGKRSELTVLGVPVGRHLSGNAIWSELGLTDLGSIIVLIATDVPLTPVQLRRLARRGALGVGRTGTSGGHYSGDLMLAFSVANPVYMPGVGERQPRTFTHEWLNDAHCEQVYPEAVAAVEEAILNALLAARSVPTYKPPGRVLDAIDPGRLMELMQRYNRLPRGTA
ncbi:MAG: P1 family peptidase [Gammaproteobacteria bacterium]|nr:P1 family peptidase [Gammaproteobacteria bacterium]